VVPASEIHPSQPSVREAPVQSPFTVPAQALTQPCNLPLPRFIFAFLGWVPLPFGKSDGDSENPPNFIQPILEDQA